MDILHIIEQGIQINVTTIFKLIMIDPCSDADGH